MIASTPIRLLSLVTIAFVMLAGVRGVVGGIDFGDEVLRTEVDGSGDRTRGVVERVVDGDTVEVTIGSDRARVRVLGISAPEVSHRDGAGECYGVAATRHLEKLLPVGARVALVSDPTQDDVDAYGRRLRYIERDGHDIGHDQIRSGAAAARAIANPVARQSAYERAEQKARKRGAGIWSECR